MKAYTEAALAVLLCALPCASAERWRMQYFYEGDDGSEFAIMGLGFATPERGLAVGYLSSGSKEKPYAVGTTDGGRTWEPVPLPEPAVSLFMLNEKAGWMVGRDKLWRTADCGRTWTRLGRAPDALRVYFVSETRGWASGGNKSLYETSDGGVTWKKVDAAAQPKTNAKYTLYGPMAFVNPKVGIVSGWSRPPRRGEDSDVPEWVDPDSASREWPATTISLQTNDGGEHWQVSETSMFGRMTELSFTPDGRGLGLVEFFGKFDYPSEVYQVNLRTGKSARAFRSRERVITDILRDPGGEVSYLAAFEPSGSMFRSPVPGKLKIVRSTDMESWQEMDVDYRALARRARLVAAATGSVWVATDTGMILRLVVD
jgi:photosystem II stability/assembly factor-like uncharacterized protein